jgi:murein DD-endopeptidase MepM/ murein hydrolase activator NlpD
MTPDSFYAAIQQLESHIHTVVPFTPTDKLLLMDFTSSNSELTDEILQDTDRFSTYIDQKLTSENAVYGIGGWNEHRTIYSRSPVFDTADEPRRLHLGIDIWGKAGTPVKAPLDAVVHSFAFNNAYGDYGTTIILQHSLHGAGFYTLYGHLNKASLNSITEGDKIAAGTQFAKFGQPPENGHWPPHLHFQVILDMGSYKGDYPGVCRFGEREKYLLNSPDPDAILQMMKYAGHADK